MSSVRKIDILGIGIAFVLMLLSIYDIFFVAPIERTMGLVQKIFYFHVPSAMAMYAGFGITSVASILYLLKSQDWLDDLAKAGCEVGVLNGIFVLISGPLWAYKAWGVAWTWEPQLTATLILFLLYFGYLLLRYLGGNDNKIKRIAAILAILSAANIPIVHFAVKQWGGLHPVVEREGGGGLSTEMQTAFTLSMITFLVLLILLVAIRYSVLSRSREVSSLHLYLDDVKRSQGRRS